MEFRLLTWPQVGKTEIRIIRGKQREGKEVVEVFQMHGAVVNLMDRMRGLAKDVRYGWVFPNAKGGSYTAQAFKLGWNRLKAAARKAGTFADKQPGIRAKLASSATTSNVERLARADPLHATAAEQWDADPLLLNTVGGIVNLKTGELLPPDRSKLLTKCATAKPHGVCPQWLVFLQTVTGGDKKLIDYLQRVIGYCLTGQTTEHALFFFYGTGANGKSVFLNVISDITTPSRADEAITKTLKAALGLIDVQVLDHIIVAGATTLSFAEHGLL